MYLADLNRLPGKKVAFQFSNSIWIIGSAIVWLFGVSSISAVIFIWCWSMIRMLGWLMYCMAGRVLVVSDFPFSSKTSSYNTALISSCLLRGSSVWFSTIISTGCKLPSRCLMLIVSKIILFWIVGVCKPLLFT